MEQTRTKSLKENGFLTPTEIATILEIHPHAIHKYLSTGRLPAQKVGRRWQIRLEDAQTFIEQYRAGEIGLSRKGFASPDHPMAGGFANPDHPLHGKRKWEGDPDSLRSRGEYTHIFLPCSQEHATWLTGILKPAERLEVLNRAAREKEAKRNGT